MQGTHKNKTAKTCCMKFMRTFFSVSLGSLQIETGFSFSRSFKVINLDKFNLHIFTLNEIEVVLKVLSYVDPAVYEEGKV